MCPIFMKCSKFSEYVLSTVIKFCRRLQWGRYVAQMGDGRIAVKFLLGKPEENWTTW